MSSTTPSTQAATRTIWKIDPAHTLVELSAKHMMFTTVKGRFTGLEGIIVDVADDPTQSSVEAEIDATTLTTGDPQRDAHLKSADFLDADNHPRITFRSTRLEGSRDHFTVTGDLTIRGTTRSVALDTTYNGHARNPFGKEVAGFSAETEINRKDFGLNWNVALEAGGWLVGDRIKINIEIQAVKQED